MYRLTAFALCIVTIAALRCGVHDAPGPVSLMSTVRASESAVPWRVVALESGLKRLANRSHGLKRDGRRLLQSLPESVYRQPLRLESQRSIVACVTYGRHRRTKDFAGAFIRTQSRTVVSDTMCVGEDFTVFQWKEVEPGLQSFELIHRANPGVHIPLKVVAIGESRPGAPLRELDDLALILRWLADSEYDIRHGLPHSKRLPISLDGCTREGMILGEGESFAVDLPRRLRGYFLAFSAVDLVDAQGISVSVFAERDADTLRTRVADRSITAGKRWFSFRVDTGLLPGGTKRIRFRVSGANALVGIAEPLLVPGEYGSEKLNLVLVDLDTVRADRLGCYGYKDRPTSTRLDSMIATKGFGLFEHAYAPSPWTLSSTAKFFASRYVHEELRNSTSSVSDETTLLAEILRKNGYYCAAFTGGAVLRTPGFERGFHEYHWSRSYGKVEDSFPQASRWLRSRVEPFFLFLHTYEAHSPYTRATFCHELGLDLPDIRFGTMARKNTMSRSESLCVQALYDGGVKAACDATADFFALMDTLDLWQRTVVVVLSDHGEELWEHFDVFARHGHSLYDELLEVPFLVYSPGNDGPQRLTERVSLVDLVPTVAELLALNWDGIADGLSLVPQMIGRPIQRRTIVATLSNGAPWGGACLFTGSYKYIEMFKKSSPDRSSTFRNLSYEPGRELYALDTDGGESENLATLDPAAAEAFSDTLQETLANLLPPLRSGTTAEARGLHPTLEEQLRVLGYVE